MSVQTKQTLKTYFETGDKPTQQQFADLIDSMALEGQGGNGSLPQTTHFGLITQEFENMEHPEVFFIGNRIESQNPATLGVGLVRSEDPISEMAILGAYMNGFRVQRSNIQADNSATNKFFISGLSSQFGTEQAESNLLCHNAQTGEITKMSFGQLHNFINLFKDFRYNLKNIDFAQINSMAANTELAINLDGTELQEEQYVKTIFVKTTAFDNISAINEAFIALPGAVNTIDIKPYLGTSTFIAIPITIPQTLISSDTNLTLTINFDLGNGEVNPQDFTQGSIDIKAEMSQRMAN